MYFILHSSFLMFMFTNQSAHISLALRKPFFYIQQTLHFNCHSNNMKPSVALMYIHTSFDTRPLLINNLGNFHSIVDRNITRKKNKINKRKEMRREKTKKKSMEKDLYVKSVCDIERLIVYISVLLLGPFVF